MSSFKFIPFGARASDDSISCDGLVSGSGLHLSHWDGNKTPDHLKADTSTEIALRYVAAETPTQLVVNNHFDADGALSVWSLLDPDLATKHRDLLIATAEAGDFDEWPSDERGLKLEAAIRKLGASADESEAYSVVLAELPSLIRSLDSRSDLWSETWDTLTADEARASKGALEVTQVGPIAVFHHRPGISELAGPVLSRHAPAGCTRWLLAFEDTAGHYRYRYELPRYAWADTITRPRIQRPNTDALAKSLGWTTDAPGMTGLMASPSLSDDPAQITERLIALDR